jgi:predicted acyl esterase
VAREALALLAYLRSLPEIPPGQVGLLGAYNATWAALLAAALEPAVKAVALEGDLTSPAERLLESNCLEGEFCHEQTRWWPPGILPLAEPADLATLLAPRPLLLFDGMSSADPPSRTLRLTEQGYAALGHKPRLETHPGWRQAGALTPMLTEFFGVWLPAELTD